MKQLSLEVIQEIWTNKTGGSVWRKSSDYEVTYSEGGKVYSYKASNLLKLAEKLKIIAECNVRLDKINVYNESLYRTLASLEQDLRKPVIDDFGFGGTQEELKEEIIKQIENIKIQLNSWNLEKELV
jgi:hypothetical protein